MKLSIEGVQNIEKGSYIFPDSGLALIYGDNAAGKSAIIRAIVAAISYDPNNKDKKIIEEEKLLGIIQDKQQSNQGLIRVGFDEAKISIQSEKLNENVSITRDGKFKGFMPSFVITNVLTDVSWIMRILTKSSSETLDDYLKGFNEMIWRYEDILDTVGEIKSKLNMSINTLNSMLKELAANQRTIDEKKKELANVTDKINAIKEELEKEALKDPKKQERISQINSQIKEKDNEIKEVAGEIRKLESNIKDIKNQIALLEMDINKKEKERNETAQKLKDYEEINPDSFSALESAIEELKNQRTKEQIFYEILKSTYLMLETEHSSEIVCPVCGSNKINKNEIEKNIKQRDEAIRTYDLEISKISRQIGELKEKVRRRKELSDKIQILNNNIEKEKNEKEHYLNTLNEKITELRDKEKKKSELEKIKNELILTLSEDPEKEKTLKTLQDLERQLQTEIKNLEMSKKYSQINILGVNYPVDIKTLDFFDKVVLSSLKDIEEHFSDLRDKEKTKLKDDFNKNIKEIIREMAFDLDIFIDNNFNIIARKKSGGSYKILDTQNLSRSEQATIALTLQLALANGYAPNINIILLDGIYEYFDDERRKKIIALLDAFGKNHNKLIIMTVVKEGVKSPMVVPV